MSSGHRHVSGSPKDEAELDRILVDSKVRRRLGAPYHFNFDFDIPYLAGYSTDASTVYIDRHMPRSIMVQGRTLGVLPGLSRHERLEKALIDLYGWPYLKSHRFATIYEERLYKKGGFTPSKVEKVYAPYIKADETERVLKVPKALDLTPYEGSKLLLEHLKGRMK